MKILVTGANGQLGSEIKDLTGLIKGAQFIFTDVDDLDLTDFENLEAYLIAQKPDFIINCAAYTAVDKAETEIELADLLNAKVPSKIAELCTKLDIRFIHISTDYVFDGKTYVPLTEEMPVEPPSQYGITKLNGEKGVQKNNNAIIIRTSWLYSCFGQNFVKTMMRLGKERSELGVVFDQVGTPTNAADLAKAILEIINYADKSNHWLEGIYHYSNEGVCSWYDFALSIMQIAGISCTVKPIESTEYPVPAPRPAFSVLNKKKIKNTFDISIPHWQDSLKKVISVLNKS